MEHVKRLVLVPEHMAEQRKKPLVPPLTAQVNEIDSDMQNIIQRQDIPIDLSATKSWLQKLILPPAA